MSIDPIYYVANPDGSYSVAEPQPTKERYVKPLSETHIYALQARIPDGKSFDLEQALIFEAGIRAAERYHGIGKE